MVRATACHSPTACMVSLQIVLGFFFIHSTLMKIRSHRAFQGEQKIVEFINLELFPPQGCCAGHLDGLDSGDLERGPSDVHVPQGGRDPKVYPKVMYTHPKEHTIIMEAIPMAETTQVRRYRGYIAIDEIKFRGGHECKGHCTFDSGFCKFSNDASANFEWEVGGSP